MGTGDSCAAGRVALPQLLSLALSQVSNRSTRLRILGSEHVLPPFALRERAAAAHSLNLLKTVDSVAAAAEHSHEWHATERQWRRTLQRALQARELRILILGTSPTAGCRAGVDARTVACSRKLEACKIRSNICDVAASWSRHFHDSLRAFIDDHSVWHGLQVTMSVHFKNAVDLAHFARCTLGFLQGFPEPHVVLLEGAANLGPHGTAHAEALAALRRAVPNARFVIAAWPRMKMVSRMLNLSQALQQSAPLTQRYPDGLDLDLERLRHAARNHASDFLNGGHVLASLALGSHLRRQRDPANSMTSGNSCPCTVHQHIVIRQPSNCSADATPPCREALSKLYALGGTDFVHPSRHGHVLFGALAAHFVARRLLVAACSSSSSTATLNSAGGEAGARTTDGRGAAYGAGEEVVEVVGATGDDELCYPRAEQVPHTVPLSAGWSLRDESTEQSVVKTGFVSEQAGGEPLRLGPILPPPSAAAVRCLGLVISLGFLVSWRPGQGALLITCEGCQCMRTKGLFAAQMAPFPFIETSTSALHFGSGTRAGGVEPAQPSATPRS